MKSILLILLLTLIVSACTDEIKLTIEKSNVEIIKHWLSDCDRHSNPYLLQSRIIEKRVANDTLFLLLGFRRNCVFEIKPRLIYRLDTLWIDNQPSIIDDGDNVRSMAECDCCFELNFIVKGIIDTSFVTMFFSEPVYLCSEKYKTYPETFEIIDGDTVNRRNSYGLREGLWIDKDSSTGMIERRVYYIVNEMMRPEEMWQENYNKGNLILKIFGDQDSIYYYNKKGNVIFKEYKNTVNLIIEFYDIGFVKSICLENSTELCIHFDEEGNKILKPND